MTSPPWSPKLQPKRSPRNKNRQIEQKKNKTVAQAPAETSSKKKAKGSFDVSAAIESIAAEADATETTVDESGPAESVAAKVEVAAKKPAVKSRVDVHDTLLSGELYEELAEGKPKRLTSR